MNTLPILLKNPKILLIGGGNVALQKAEVLDENNIDFEMISNMYLAKFKKINIKKYVKLFTLSDVSSFNIIINATGCEDITNQLLKEKQKRFFFLNVVDVPPLCDFYFSSLLKYGGLKIAISSDGGSPTITQIVRQKIKEIIPKEIESFCKKVTQDRFNGIIDVKSTRQKTKKLLNPIYLIGCGLGDVELLTIKAYKIIQTLDVVFYDNLITQEILDIIPENTKKVFVGKSKGNHSLVQEEINSLLLKYAKEGKKIARLKSGDPYIFGRGYEEYEFLTSNGFSVEVINGLSSAIAGVAMGGIPLTHRGVSNSFSVVSAHLKDGELNLYWLDLLKKEKHTTVVLMGLSYCKYIQEEALKMGINKDFKVAIIANASRENQKIIRTTIEKLYEQSIGVKSPAILIFGDVTNL